jgi:hypothetical protein
MCVMRQIRQATQKSDESLAEVLCTEFDKYPRTPATHSCLRPGFPKDRRMGRKSQLLAHLVSSSDSQFAEVKVEIAESLRPWSQIFPFCGVSAEIGSITTAARGRKLTRGSCADRCTPAPVARPGIEPSRTIETCGCFITTSGCLHAP